EELLRWWAGPGGPAPGDAAGRKGAARNARDSWKRWWLKEGKAIRADRSARKAYRPRLLLVYDDFGTVGERIWLCGSDGKPRWEMRGLSEVSDFEWLPSEGQL